MATYELLTSKLNLLNEAIDADKRNLFYYNRIYKFTLGLLTSYSTTCFVLGTSFSWPFFAGGVGASLALKNYRDYYEEKMSNHLDTLNIVLEIGRCVYDNDTNRENTEFKFN